MLTPFCVSAKDGTPDLDELRARNVQNKEGRSRVTSRSFPGDAGRRAAKEEGVAASVRH